MQTIQTNKVYNTIQAKNTIQTNKEYNTKEYNEEIIQYNTNKEYNTNEQKTYNKKNTIQYIRMQYKRIKSTIQY
jgi:precorrin-6B methylase 2